VAKRLSRYFAAMLDGRQILDAPPQYVWGFTDDSMAPAFPAGTQALYERRKGELVAGGYYVFVGRGRKAPRMVRRYLRTTPTGRYVVELFKGKDGKPHRAHLAPDQWSPHYRIVRHW
jgi:hypothetical protein